MLILFSISGYAQNSTADIKFWKLRSYNGEVMLYGSYWDQYTIRNNFEINEQNTLYSMGFQLNTNSYFYHPNFLILDLNLGYSPDTGQRFSLVTPNRNETHNLKKLYVKTTFLQKNDLNFNFFASYNENYSNRENLTNIKSYYYNIGGVFNYTNKFIPFYVSYDQGKGEQEELQTNRIYRTTRKDLEARANKSFGKLDRNELRFSHNEYTYEDSFYTNILNPDNKLVESNITSWSLNNDIFFDKKKKYYVSSRILRDDQYGNINFKRFQVLENVNFNLPKNFKFYSGYKYFDYQSDAQDSKQHNINASISHQLYNSLRTSAFIEYNLINNTQFTDDIRRMGIDIDYNKKIPLDGKLSINYILTSNNQNRNSVSESLIIQNERQTLQDSEIVLLKNQNINISTVVVKDISNTIIYILNLDYILIERNEFIEIQRVPGGQIPNNTTVLIDYEARQPNSYNFNAVYSFLGIRVGLFKNLIEFYYNLSKQDYFNTENTENVTLNYFDKNVYGTRFNYKYISGSIEYDDYSSTIIPYRLMRYRLTLQGNLFQKLNYSLNSEILDYKMIETEGQKQVYYNISGNLAYNFSANTRLNLEGGYRKQEGDADGIYLDLLTSRLEFTTVYRRIYITAAAEVYRRKLTDEQLDFNKVSLKITRRF